MDLIERQNLFSKSRYANQSKQLKKLSPFSLSNEQVEELIAIRKVISKLSPGNSHSSELSRLLNHPEILFSEREYFEQTLFFAELLERYPSVYAVTASIPNGGFRKKAERFRLLASGQKAGWPDIQIMMQSERYGGLFIEMKKPIRSFASLSAARRAVSTEQSDVINRLCANGYAATVAYGHFEAIGLLRRYLDNEELTSSPTSANGCRLRGKEGDSSCERLTSEPGNILSPYSPTLMTTERGRIPFPIRACHEP